MGYKDSHVLTLDERLRIEKFLKDGRKTGNIAYHLNRSHSCIKQEIRRNGGRSHYDAQKAQEAHESKKRSRLLLISKGLTEEQQKVIQSAVDEGLSIHRMSKKLNISVFRLTKYIKSKNIKYTRKNYTSFEDRISSLEMQLEIIIDTLKELKNVKHS